MIRKLALAAVLALATPALSSKAWAAPDAAALQTRLAALRARVELLKDHEKIENLQAAYGFYFDKALWGEVADLFADDGTFEYGQMGVYAGKAHIRKALTLFSKEGPEFGKLNNHMQLQSIIDVAPDGKTAKARFRGMVQLGRSNQPGQWGDGDYENEYVKQNGVWKIARLHFYPDGFTDYDAGWTKSAIPLPGPSAAIPPDRPPSEVYRGFPGVYIPPYHYAHPVTGKPMDIPEPADSVLGRK